MPSTARLYPERLARAPGRESRAGRPSARRRDRKSQTFALLATYALAAVVVGAFSTRAPRVLVPDPSSAAGASGPTQVPARAWYAIARSVLTRIGENRVIAVAAGLTFYGILALFPAISALVSIYGLYADPSTIQDQLAYLSGVLPGGAISIVGDQIENISSQGEGTLGFAFLSGLAVALWSANAGVKALFDGLNVAYETQETRGFFKLNAISLLFTSSAVILALFGFSATIVLPWVLENVFFGYGHAATMLRWLSMPLAIALAIFILAVLYRFGPAVKKPAWRWVTPGSLFAVGFLIASSTAFAYYANHFGSYNKTYGTLGAAIGFMTWLWISSIVVLVGAEINAEVERQAKGRTPSADKSPLLAR